MKMKFLKKIKKKVSKNWKILLFVLFVIFISILFLIGAKSLFVTSFLNKEDFYSVSYEPSGSISMVVSDIQTINNQSIIYITITDIILFNTDEEYCVNKIEFFPYVSNNSSFYFGNNFPGNLYNVPFYNPENFNLTEKNIFTFDDTFCAEKTKYVHLKDTENKELLLRNPFVINIIDNNFVQNFTYPFDERNYQIIFELSVIDQYGLTRNIQPDILITFPANEWITSANKYPKAEILEKWGYDDFQTYVDKTNINKKSLFSLTYKRSPYTVILTCFVVFLAIIFSLSLIFINDNKFAAEFTLALLIGIWGIKDIVVPPNNQGNYSSALLVIYYIFSFSVIFRFIISPLFAMLILNKRRKQE